MDAFNAFVTVQSSCFEKGRYRTEHVSTAEAYYAAEEGKSFVIRYREAAGSGLEGTETVLRVRGGLAVMEREGSVSCRFVFGTGRNSTVSYCLPEGEMKFSLHTYKLAYSLDVRGGWVEMTYVLGQGEDLSGADKRRLQLLVKRKEDS